MRIEANGPFNYTMTYDFMAKQDDCLYEAHEGKLRRAVHIDGKAVLFEVTSHSKDAVAVDILYNEGAKEGHIRKYVVDWLDLDYDLEAFYRFAAADPRLSQIIGERTGYRMTCKPDIMEALMWAVLGQQINMAFAYILKRRIVEHFGHHVEYEGRKYWLMPTSEELSSLDAETLRDMQVSYRKAEYLGLCAAGVKNGELSKGKLLAMGDYDAVLKYMTSFKGIGPWSANTVLMRTLKYRNAVPIGDAGLRNAIRLTDGLEERPDKAYIISVIEGWGGYGAYATLYMWHILF